MSLPFTPQAVLFDLDGTLLDTAPDFLYTVNILLNNRNQAEVSLEHIRPYVGMGLKKFIEIIFKLEPDDPNVMELKSQAMEIYQANFNKYTEIFHGIENLLENLNQKNIPYSIVTNKHYYLAEKLISHFKFDTCQCLVGGDSLAKPKPDPMGLLYACNKMQVNPRECLYVGDAESDIVAAREGGLLGIAANYGYIHCETDVTHWEPSFIINHPDELINLLDSK